MVSKKAFIFLLAGFFFICLKFSYAQFGADVTSGCSPLSVQFTGYANATNINWNFMDGGSAGTANPAHNFIGQGTYNVTYSATVNGNPVNETITINVFGHPSPSFTANSPTSGCIPLTVSFDDNSTGGGGTAIVDWDWSFGDGTGDTTGNANPSHTYVTGDSYSVILIVTDANGCDSSLSINMVNTSVQPSPIITSNVPLSSCTAPYTVQFNGSSSQSHSTTGSTALTYSWNLGGGNVSTSPNPPAVTFDTMGVYPVWLTVTDNNNCSDSVLVNVAIQAPVASFTVNDTVCKNVVFTVNTPGTTNFWNYGDGQTGVVPSHFYASPGTYNVTLTVISGSCQDDTTRTIVVEEPDANFNFTPSYFCSLPGTVSFTNTSTGAATYSWNFFESSNQYVLSQDTSTLTNPSFVISYIDTNRYTINNQVVFINVMLAASTLHGCIDYKTKTLIDTIFLPTARFVPDRTLGCAPLTVDFADSSLSREDIISWHYEFDDGTVYNSSTSGNTTHTYNLPGVYSAILIIENARGCIDTSYAINIYVGTPPHPDFTAAPTDVCVGMPVQFNSIFPASDSVDTWHFNTDGGTFMSSCPNDPNPTWSYINSTGPQDVTLTACWHGCCADTTKSGYINVKGPLVHGSVRMNCDTPYTYIFTAEIQDADSWVMNYGDGISDSVTAGGQTIFTHVYATRGDFMATLTGYNSTTGCVPSVDSMQIKVREIIARTGTDTLACGGASVDFDASQSQDVQTRCHGGYIWLWGDGSGPKITDQPVAYHSYSPGSFVATLIVSDANGCRDTARRYLKAYGMNPGFVSSDTYFCVPGTLSFNNTSTADTTITGYQWSFGDGTVISTSPGTPDTSHLFINPGPNVFNVTLTVSTALGCQRNYTYNVIRSKPFAHFYVTDSTLCAGIPTEFHDSVPALPHPNTLYTYNFGDGTPIYNTSSTALFTHAYASAGNYTVTYTVTDSIGCTNTKIKPAYISVQDYPQAGFISTADTATKKCYPFICDFTDTSVANIFQFRNWDLDNGSVIVPNPSVTTTYQIPGDYVTTLIVGTTYGCTDTISKTINVIGPLAEFTMDKNIICKGDSIMFTIHDTTDIYTWQWDFGDGFVMNSGSPVTHQYNYHPPSGSTNASLIFWGADMTCKQTRQQTINIYQVIADFDRNNETTASDTAHCIGLTDNFTNVSMNADVWSWNFGDGGTAGQTNSETHTFASPGIYDVSIAILNNQTGCVDTLKKKMVVHALPQAIATGADTCVGKGIQIHATGGVKYVWTPSTGLSNDTIADPFASPVFSTTYTATVTDSNGCVNTDTAFVYIQQEPVQSDWDTTIVIGSPVQLNAAAGPGFVYSWTPTSDLSCMNCFDPKSTTLVDIKYTVTISDEQGCFHFPYDYTIHVLPVSSVDVPTAFTPNGDGVNDIVYVGGWGIKKLLEFRIYNRWGELLYEGTDIDQGWDGTFKGVPQNVETYVYQVKVETYIDAEPLTKKGYVKLLR